SAAFCAGKSLRICQWCSRPRLRCASISRPPRRWDLRSQRRSSCSPTRHFSHDGHDDDLGFFVGVGEAIVEGFEGGTVSACAEGGHVEDITDRHPTTVDAAVSLELAAVEVIGCEADEGGDLFAAHLPEFWQQGDEREGQHRADAWHRGQQLIALSESHI